MDATLECLSGWMPRQRWYSARAHAPTLRIVASQEHPSPDPHATVRTLFVADEQDDATVLYQVPVVTRHGDGSAMGSPGGEHVIGESSPGTILLDGPHDPAYTTALLRGIDEESGDGAASVMRGEQSNTSIVYAAAAGRPAIICKVFRQLHPGLNPDIELQTALSGAGSRHVPRVFGSLGGSWTDPRTGETVDGSLAFAQEFLSGVEDAWRVALRTAASGRGFGPGARELGRATAEVHADLARLFPTVGDDGTAPIADAWRRRLSIAVAEAPALEPLRERIEAVYRRAEDAPWPAMQRIHGDYHLGQVLHAGDRGWILLDFEGEPMRPMAERRLPDLAARDVAGMLRSFDYVAGSLGNEHPERADEHRRWADEARASFLAGYEETAGTSCSGPLLDAFELDKAVYETLYEVRNRPTWVRIPLDAVRRLVGAGQE
jgi:predicted trehalose synthase